MSWLEDLENPDEVRRRAEDASALKRAEQEEARHEREQMWKDASEQVGLLPEGLRRMGTEPKLLARKTGKGVDGSNVEGVRGWLLGYDTNFLNLAFIGDDFQFSKMSVTNTIWSGPGVGPALVGQVMPIGPMEAARWLLGDNLRLHGGTLYVIDRGFDSPDRYLSLAEYLRCFVTPNCTSNSERWRWPPWPPRT